MNTLQFLKLNKFIYYEIDILRNLNVKYKIEFLYIIDNEIKYNILNIDIKNIFNII